MRESVRVGIVTVMVGVRREWCRAERVVAAWTERREGTDALFACLNVKETNAAPHEARQ